MGTGVDLELVMHVLSVSPGDMKNPDHFRYAEETKLAWEEGKLSDDIKEEQRKLTEADLIIFQVCILRHSCD